MLPIQFPPATSITRHPFVSKRQHEGDATLLFELHCPCAWVQQKVTIKMHMECDTCRNKALKIASSIKGVTQVSIEGNDKDRVVVIGEDVDTVCLGRMLRKKFRGVTVLTVEEVKPPKPPENKDKDKDKDKGKGKDDKGKGKDDKGKDKLKTCTVCIVPCNPCPGVHCDPCSRCHSQKCHGECKPCTKCESLKCHGDCKACARCGSFKCSGQCASSICVRPPPAAPACYGHCPPWMPCPSCCLKRPYDPYCYHVVYDSSPDSCSIQ